MAGRVNTVRKDTSKRNNLAEEELEESSDEEEYRAVEVPENMELDTDAVYTLHEQIGLEWPSGTVCVTPDKDHILVETSSVDKRISEMYKLAINIRDINRRIPEKEMKYSAASPINRIRMKNEYIYTVAEKCFSVYSPDMILLKEKPILGTFALCTKRSIFYGNGGQLIRERSIDDKNTESIKTNINTNENEIFSVSGISEDVAAVSTKMISLADFRCNSKENIKSFYSSIVDINAIDYNEENIILAGSDTGSLFLFDIRSEKHPLEKIDFHRSPITQVSFSSPDIFASSSDCEVALWDTTFTEEWEYHKYLSFVHQGQKYYKDFQFISENTLITTSLDGLCIFTPKTDIELM